MSDLDLVAYGLGLQRPVYRTAASDELLTLLLEPLAAVAADVRELRAHREAGLAGSGYALGEYGARIGIRRVGRDDDAFRRALFSRLSEVNSDGVPEDVLAVLRLVLGRGAGSLIRRRRLRGQAIYTLLGIVVASQAELAELHALVQPAAAAGIRITLVGGAAYEAASFRFRSRTRIAASASIGATELAYYPGARIPLSAWCQVQGSPITSYRVATPGVMTLGAPLGAAVAAGDWVDISRTAAGGAYSPGEGWGVGRLVGRAG